jgi:hypothetical protein
LAIYLSPIIFYGLITNIQVILAKMIIIMYTLSRIRPIAMRFLNVYINKKTRAGK